MANVCVFMSVPLSLAGGKSGRGGQCNALAAWLQLNVVDADMVVVIHCPAVAAGWVRFLVLQLPCPHTDLLHSTC
jgi:hypothetical protein